MSSRSSNILNPSPPAISLTPAVSQGRSRSGTLPSYTSHPSNSGPAISPLISGNNNVNSHDPLGLPNMDHISLGLPGTHAVDIPIQNTNTGSSRRMRSGSLFSTSSIWNDEAITASPSLVDNASIHSASSGSFLSPRLSAQPSSIQGIHSNHNNNNNHDNGNNNTGYMNNINNHNINGNISEHTFIDTNGSTHNHNTNNNPNNNFNNDKNNNDKNYNNGNDIMKNDTTIRNPTNSFNLSNDVTGVSASSVGGSVNVPRNRSYTTTAAISSALSQGNYTSDPNALFPTAFNQSNEMNSYLDNLLNTGGIDGGMGNNGRFNVSALSNNDNNINNNNNNNNLNVAYGNIRNRSQTYSGTTPTLPEATLNIAELQYGGQNLLSQNPNAPPRQNGVSLQPHNSQLNPGASQFPQYSGLSSFAQPSEAPILQDDFDITKVNITTNFENSSLGPTRFILFDNLPHFIDSLKMWSILSNSIGNHRSSGSVKSVRVSTLTTSNVALVECSSIEAAMGLKASFNHLELVPGVIIYVAFVKFEDQPLPSQQQQVKGPSPEADVTPTSNSATANSTGSSGGNKSTEPSKVPPTDLLALQDQLLKSIQRLNSISSKPVDMRKIQSIISKSISYANENYQDNFGPLPDPIPLRQFDSPKLRDLRKLLDKEGSPGPNNQDTESTGDQEDGGDASSATTVPDSLSQLELEEICLAMLDELPELCYDYLGNTIVQKLFSQVESPLIKLMMVKEITPYLTQLGIHKNGTWAIQKIINLCAKRDFQQEYLIGASLKPYSVKLFNDQFGNYVLQGCLKFGSPFNDFIFEVMLDNFLEISLGRFGARSIRTILETAASTENENNEIVSKEQILLVAGLIVEFSNELVLNNNGSLLITWFIDTYKTSNGSDIVDERYKVLVEKFLPRLDTLCCHKLANLTILKILNNRTDMESKQKIIDAIFGKFNEFDEELTPVPSKLLETILAENPENSAGPVFIYKVLSSSILTGNGEEEAKSIKYQNFVLSQVRRILLELNINNMQPYKKLMDEVGLSSTKLNRTSSLNGGKRNKRGGRNRQQQNHHSHQQIQHQHQQNPPHQNQQHQVQQNHQNHFKGQNAQQMPFNGQFNPQYQQQYSVLMAQQMLQQQQQQQQQQQSQQHLSHQHKPPRNHLNTRQQPSNISHQQEPGQQQDYYQQQQQDQVLMQQLEQLSLSSAALGYNSNPDTPTIASSQRTSFL